MKHMVYPERRSSSQSLSLGKTGAALWWRQLRYRQIIISLSRPSKLLKVGTFLLHLLQGRTALPSTIKAFRATVDCRYLSIDKNYLALKQINDSSQLLSLTLRYLHVFHMSVAKKSKRRRKIYWNICYPWIWDRETDNLHSLWPKQINLAPDLGSAIETKSHMTWLE